MNRLPKSIYHIARYGIPADQHFLLNDFTQTYDQLVVNANILAHQPTAVAGFIASKAKKPFFIDPQTHAFQHNLSHITSESDKNKGKIKTSVEKLIKRYGRLVATAILDEHRPLTSADFSNNAARQAFVKNVLSFQEIVIEGEVGKTDAHKYYEFLKKKKIINISKTLSPCRLIAPYFYLDKHLESWLDVNIKCLQDAISMRDGKNIAAEIVISKEILSSTKKIDSIVAQYSQFKNKLNSILVWIDNFNETTESPESLSAFVDFLNKLSPIAPVINLYGGYFSVVLGRYGIVPNLVGVSHGLEYGETRSVVPVGGGLPIAKFYLPSLHLRLPSRDAYRAVREYGALSDKKVFYKEICDCKECQGIIKKPDVDFDLYLKSKELTYEINGGIQAREFPLPETKGHLINHYMWTKQREYLANTNLAGVIAGLEKADGTLKKALNYYEQVAHCRRWIEIIKPENA